MSIRTYNKKSIVISLTAALSLAAVAAGCSTGAKDPGKTGDSKEPAPSNQRGSITVSIYDRGQIPKEEGTYAENRWTKWVNENGPVNVKYVPVPRNESQQKFSMMFAAGEAPDLIQEFDNAFVNTLWGQKQLLPLNDLIDKHSTEYKALLQKFPQISKLATKPDGKMYEFSRITKPEVLATMVIRKDWLDKLNLKVPETMEELYNVADAFANKDPDGNGKKDTFGINLSQSSSYYVDAMFQNEMFIIENGELIRQFDRIKPAYEFKKKLFENGIVDKDFLTDKNGQKAEQDFASGRLGIFLAYNTVVSKNFDTLKKANPNAEIIAMPFPKSQFGQFGPEINPALQLTASINASAKDPVAVMKYVDFMVKQSTVDVFTNGIEGVHYKKDGNGCAQPIDAAKNKTELSYVNDYKLFMPLYLVKSCLVGGRSEYSTNPLDQEWIKIAKEMDKIYLDPSRPHPGFTHAKFRPSLDKDLNTIFNDGWNNMNDIMAKTIVSGSSYTVDQGVKDVKDAWDKAGGKKLEDWYKNWYKENKSSWLFMDDVYKMKME
ncbi:putative aldouronate transport system substrate-binding protein [Paenibacillus sp. UNCCL117]|uniref:extracellular solute-binding protein n=1 Tax=unclassified Paenibacillus TaxID=185978 RepID=UPI000884454C|nr:MULTISPECIES: extracellular solute-binding protein [unclassified Paenibacillus]SDD63917.1 putative aldouronate transport system substrate-binding protein [Paenibacillus sp. cl123]SFW58425.1 putative aldouronate transport system substrate-binding protein [Paenibacillus sp. UNCCL117]